MRIINFHGVGSPVRDLDEGEAPFWLARPQFCAVLDRIAAHPERKNLMLTFDDGNSSDLGIAAPELRSRGLMAIFFVLTGRLGLRGSLDRDDVGELSAYGMKIGSHGINHRDLSALGPAELCGELCESKEMLEDICAAPVGTIAIPFGRYNAKVLRAARDAGYRVAYTSDGGKAQTDAFVQPRRSLRGDMGPGEIDRILMGHIPMLRRVRRSVAMAVKRFS